MKHARLATEMHRLRARLWLAPAGAAILALIASRATVAIDAQLPGERAWFAIDVTPDGARELLSTVTSAMITFTGVVFSITIVVLQLASGQFSPRVLRTFLEDRHSHAAMAMFVGTFVYAMGVLPSIHGADSKAEPFVPYMSVLIAFVLVLASVGVFVHYIDRMAHSVRAITLIKRVSSETRHSIEQMYPERLGVAPIDSITLPDEPASVISNHQHGGVLAAIDEDALVALARKHDALVAVVPRLGDFIPHGAPVLRWWGASPPFGREALSMIAIEVERTAHQDPLFGFRQLVDVAIRALSPAVNDPSTAVQVLDELHDLLRLLATRREPSSVRRDEAGVPRLVIEWPTWSSFVELALDEIRNYGGASLQVQRRSRIILDDLREVAPPQWDAALDRQRALLDAYARREISEPSERAAVQTPRERERRGHASPH